MSTLPLPVKLTLFSTLFAFGLAVVVIPASKASNLTITCSQSGCDSVSEVLFNEQDLSPLTRVSKTIKAVNTDASTLSFGVLINESNFNDSTPSLAEAITISIVPAGESNPVYGPVTLKQWKQDGLVRLGSVAGKSDKSYDFIATLTDVGNEYQTKTLRFDLSVGFEALEIGGTSISTATTTTTAAAATPPPAGLVLGAISKSQGQILGTEGEALVSASQNQTSSVLGTADICKPNVWWWPLAVQVVLMLLLMRLKQKLKLLAAVVLFGFSQMAHLLVGCGCLAGWCIYYWLFNLIIALCLFIYRRR